MLKKLEALLVRSDEAVACTSDSTANDHMPPNQRAWALLRRAEGTQAATGQASWRGVWVWVCMCVLGGYPEVVLAG